MPRQHEFDKDDVLDKAMRLFWARGFEATSVRDLTHAMGISSSLYEAFGDKRAISLAALARYCGFEQARLLEIASTAASPAEFVTRLFASPDTIAGDDAPTQGSFAFNTMVEFGPRDAGVTAQLLDHYTKITAIVTQVLERWQQTNAVTSAVPASELAHTLLSALIGVITIGSVSRSYAHRDSVTRLMLKLIEPPL